MTLDAEDHLSPWGSFHGHVHRYVLAHVDQGSAPKRCSRSCGRVRAVSFLRDVPNLLFMSHADHVEHGRDAT